MDATHYCGECDGAYMIERPEGPSNPARFCPGCGRCSLMRVEATVCLQGGDDFTARVESAIAKHMPEEERDFMVQTKPSDGEFAAAKDSVPDCWGDLMEPVVVKK